MIPRLPRWDALAVHLIRDQGWRGMPEAAAIAILAAAHIPFSLLRLTILEMLERAGHCRKPPSTLRIKLPVPALSDTGFRFHSSLNRNEAGEYGYAPRFRNASNAASV